MEQTPDHKKQFSFRKRIASFAHAGRGIRIFFQKTHNAWIHSVLLLFVIVLGFCLKISASKWIALILAGGFVLTAEAFNSAIEVVVDLASPHYHSFAKDTKDIAAGAVLIAACTACIVGLVVFVPYLR